MLPLKSSASSRRVSVFSLKNRLPLRVALLYVSESIDVSVFSLKNRLPLQNEPSPLHFVCFCFSILSEESSSTSLAAPVPAVQPARFSILSEESSSTSAESLLRNDPRSRFQYSL